MVLPGNITVKQKPAGATDRDLPWWFELYHIAWLISFPAIWYFFGFSLMLVYALIVAAYFATFN